MSLSGKDTRLDTVKLFFAAPLTGLLVLFLYGVAIYAGWLLWRGRADSLFRLSGVLCIFSAIWLSRWIDPRRWKMGSTESRTSGQ